MNKKLTLILLSIAILVSIILHFYKINQVPPCINADEAAFSYNAFSILKTGRDEYGALLPLRLKSFEDFKLPLYTYLSIPIVWIFGLNDFSTRFLNIIIGVSFVPLVFLIAKELFNRRKIALAAAFLTSLNPGIYILSRHAHEGVLGSFFILLMFYFLIKFLKHKDLKNFIWSNFFLLLGTYSYQTGRVYMIFFLLFQFLILLKEQNFKIYKIKKALLAVLVSVFIAGSIFDFIYGVNRVKNLLFFKNPGFQLKLNEYLIEHNFRPLHNKLTESVREITMRYIRQLSPEYFLINGDTNWRFGFPNLGIFTPAEYLLLFIGLYYFFHKNEKFRYIILFLFFIAPLNNALTWQDPSLIRAYIIIFPMIFTIAYGLVNLLEDIKDKKVLLAVVGVIGFIFIFYLVNNWDLYFNHYPKRAMTVRAWQCGYKELVNYVQSNYNRFDKFVITDRHGQPYIFFLYFMKYDPAKYQNQAKISAPDQYGFGQVGKFDKFVFNFHFDPKLKRTMFVGYPDEMRETDINPDLIKKIKIRTEEMFWIYESK